MLTMCPEAWFYILFLLTEKRRMATFIFWCVYVHDQILVVISLWPTWANITFTNMERISQLPSISTSHPNPGHFTNAKLGQTKKQTLENVGSGLGAITYFLFFIDARLTNSDEISKFWSFRAQFARIFHRDLPWFISRFIYSSHKMLNGYLLMRCYLVSTLDSLLDFWWIFVGD